ncbi:saccharopine dehydrogenase NADP-binding domain-containing protein [Microbacterium sp. F2E]|nr:saccharopine dehydrogenase NADP-binding domain-containing protein [Microbacterium sp. F2E]
MTETLPWLVYGAGTVGRAVVELLVGLGKPVLLAGRGEGRVRGLAGAAGVPYQVGDVSYPDRLLKGVSGVINTAGPFKDAGPQLMSACIRTGVHYVDVSNEAGSHIDAWSRASEARVRGIGMIVGAGMGTWFSERLVHALAAELDDPVSAHLFMVPSGGVAKSPGVTASQNVVLSDPALAIVDGQMKALRRRVRALPAGAGQGAALAVGTGDVIALEKSTGFRTVTVSAGVRVTPRVLGLVLPLLTVKARWSAAHPARHSAQSHDSHLAVSLDDRRPRLFAEVTGADGVRVQGWLSSRSGSTVAAHTAVAAMQLLALGGLAGTHTPYQVLGHHALGSGLDPVIEIYDRA